jgi:hypothetical protein
VQRNSALQRPRQPNGVDQANRVSGSAFLVGARKCSFRGLKQLVEALANNPLQYIVLVPTFIGQQRIIFTFYQALSSVRSKIVSSGFTLFIHVVENHRLQ